MHDKKKVTQLNNTKTLFFLKPMMNISEMITNLKQKNVKFNLITEEAAKEYFKSNNNYYNIALFKHNFQKYPSPAGKYEGLYQNLDFAYLKDLAIIDYRVRLILFKIIINIEHYLKLQILNTIDTMKLENGYRIVNMYLENDFNNPKFPKKVHNNILKKVGNEYYQKIFSKSDGNMDKKIENIPIWEFLEIITYGELVNFYDFYTKQYHLLEENKDVYILKDIVKFWNGLLDNKLISQGLISKMFSKQSGDGTDEEEGYYGYGVWVIDNPEGKDYAYFQGCDPGVSFISEYNPNNGIISVMVSNYGDNVCKEMRKVRKELY